MTEVRPFDRIVAALKERGISETQGAKNAGLNPSAIPNARRNNGNMALPTIEAFAKSLGCSVASLLGSEAQAAEQPAAAPTASPLYRLVKDALPIEKRLQGARALVVYFATDVDREEFVDIFQQAKPNCQTVRVP